MDGFFCTDQLPGWGYRAVCTDGAKVKLGIKCYLCDKLADEYQYETNGGEAQQDPGERVCRSGAVIPNPGQEPCPICDLSGKPFRECWKHQPSRSGEHKGES
jgi:hypothetical protein